MTNVRSALVPMFAIATMAAVAMPVRTAPPLRAEVRLCTLQPGTTLALIHVEQDTTLPFVPTDVQMMSGSGVRAGPVDSLLATASTLMPAARVRVLQLDSSSRAILASNGVSASQPIAFIRAAPYRADCRPTRGTVPRDSPRAGTWATYAPLSHSVMSGSTERQFSLFRKFGTTPTRVAERSRSESLATCRSPLPR